MGFYIYIFLLLYSSSIWLHTIAVCTNGDNLFKSSIKLGKLRAVKYVTSDPVGQNSTMYFGKVESLFNS